MYASPIKFKWNHYLYVFSCFQSGSWTWKHKWLHQLPGFRIWSWFVILLNFQEFCFIMKDKDCGRDTETGYKEAFRLFCIQHFVQSEKICILSFNIFFSHKKWTIFVEGRSVGTRRDVSLPMKSSNLRIFHICLFIIL